MPTHLRLIGAAALLPCGSQAVGEVKSLTPAGFEVESRAVIAATPAQTYAMLGRIGEWWSGDHSYSGNAANMRLKLKAGGCFCEHIPADRGTIEHMRVVYSRPGQTLRLQGGLGPLQAEGATGTLTWSLKAVPGGTEVTQTYVVGGYIRMGAEKLAPLVDKVMAEQLARLRQRLAR